MSEPDPSGLKSMRKTARKLRGRSADSAEASCVPNKMCRPNLNKTKTASLYFELSLKDSQPEADKAVFVYSGDLSLVSSLRVIARYLAPPTSPIKRRITITPASGASLMDIKKAIRTTVMVVDQKVVSRGRTW